MIIVTHNEHMGYQPGLSAALLDKKIFTSNDENKEQKIEANFKGRDKYLTYLFLIAAYKMR